MDTDMEPRDGKLTCPEFANPQIAGAAATTATVTSTVTETIAETAMTAIGVAAGTAVMMTVTKGANA